MQLLEKCKNKPGNTSIREKASQDLEYACEDIKIAEYMHEKLVKELYPVYYFKYYKFGDNNKTREYCGRYDSCY